MSIELHPYHHCFIVVFAVFLLKFINRCINLFIVIKISYIVDEFLVLEVNCLCLLLI